MNNFTKCFDFTKICCRFRLHLRLGLMTHLLLQGGHLLMIPFCSNHPCQMAINTTFFILIFSKISFFIILVSFYPDNSVANYYENIMDFLICKRLAIFLSHKFLIGEISQNELFLAKNFNLFFVTPILCDINFELF